MGFQAFERMVISLEFYFGKHRMYLVVADYVHGYCRCIAAAFTQWDQVMPIDWLGQDAVAKGAYFQVVRIGSSIRLHGL